MAMDAVQLADEVRVAMGFPAPTSAQLIGWARGIIEEIQENATATFGVIPGPHPVSGMTAASMATKVVNYAGYGTASPQLISFCQGIINHINAISVVTYTAPTGLPVPSENYKLLGTISATNGPGMAAEIITLVPYPTVSTQLLAECTAVANHINNNAEVNVGVIT